MIYLDNAATTFPKPERVYTETLRCMREYAGNAGRGSHALAVRAADAVYECRCAAARLFGAKPENVVFTYNATYALNIAIKAFVARRSHVLISNFEHNAVLRPVAALAERGELSCGVFDLRAPDISAELSVHLLPSTRAVICTLASNVCGVRAPMKEIGKFCREHGLLFIADGSQAAGHTSVNVNDCGIDVLCLPGHKGLYGPQGTGMLVLSHEIDGETVIEGGAGVNSADTYMPPFLPERYEAGTLACPALAGLCEGIGFVTGVGVDNIAAHENALFLSLASRLADDARFTVYESDKSSSVLSFNVVGCDPSEVGRALDGRGICVRTGLHCAPLAHKTLATQGGTVRVSFGAFNTEADVRALCDALIAEV